MAQSPVTSKFITQENITQVFDIVREYNKARKKGEPILHWGSECGWKFITYTQTYMGQEGSWTRFKGPQNILDLINQV